MNKIMVSIKLFDIDQQIDIYKNGEHTYDTCKLIDLEQKCCELCKANDIHEVVLIGQKDYTLKVKEKISNLTQYNNNNLDIKVVVYSF